MSGSQPGLPGVVSVMDMEVQEEEGEVEGRRENRWRCGEEEQLRAWASGNGWEA